MYCFQLYMNRSPLSGGLNTRTHTPKCDSGFDQFTLINIINSMTSSATLTGGGPLVVMGADAADICSKLFPSGWIWCYVDPLPASYNPSHT